MNLISRGADAVPAAETTGETKHFRLISVGKKTLPDPEDGGGKGKGKKATFWATVVTVGEDLKKLESGLGGKEYETKTRGRDYTHVLMFLPLTSNARNSPPGPGADCRAWCVRNR